jgi:integrase
MYYAGLRPSEAVIARWGDLVDLPGDGWGTLRLRKAAADAGKAFTDTGTARQETGLKWREDNAVRVVPLPPVLVRLLRDFMPTTVEADALVCPGRGGEPASSSTVQREWSMARGDVLGAEVDRRCLHRPYSLRHSAASLWLGLGIGPADVAARLGHSIEELLRTYADVLRSHREAANGTIGEALVAAAERVAAPAPVVDPAAEVERLRAELAALQAQLGAAS